MRLPDFTPIVTRAEDPAPNHLHPRAPQGPPKGVLHAHRALLGHLPGFELSHCFFPQSGDVFWTPADWAWAGGLLDSLLPSWHYGIPILGLNFAKKFDPEQLSYLFDKYNVRNTFSAANGTQDDSQKSWYTSHGHNLKVRTVMSAGESLGAETHAWASGILCGLPSTRCLGKRKRTM